MSGTLPMSAMSRIGLVRVPRPAGDDAGEKARVDHLRALAGVVVDLLVRARRQKAGERVDRGQHASERKRPGLADHVLLGDPALDEAPGKRSRKGMRPHVEVEVGVERDEPRLAPGGVGERLAVGRDELLRARRSGALGDVGLGDLGLAAEAVAEAVQQLADRRLVLLRRRRARVVGVERGTAALQRERLEERDAGALDGVGKEELRAIGLALEQVGRASSRAQPCRCRHSARSPSRTRRPSPRGRRDPRRARPTCRTGSCCGRR